MGISGDDIAVRRHDADVMPVTAPKRTNLRVSLGSAVGACVCAATIVVAPATATAQECLTSSTSTKCLSRGDAEINNSIPVPPAGPWAVYGSFWGGNSSGVTMPGLANGRTHHVSRSH